MRKILKYTGIGLLSLLLIAFLLPIIFKGKILSLVKTEINKNVRAKVDFKDVSLSLFRHFPKLSVGLEDLNVTGVESFEKDTLLSASRVDASVNLLSLFGGKSMTIYGVDLVDPRIHALVNEQGKANWDIAIPDTATATGAQSSFKMSLNRYAIKNGYVYYKDEQSGMKAEISGLDHEGSGDFTNELFTLSTKTTAGAANFTYASIPYLVNAKTDINADFEIDNSSSKYAFKNAEVSVNDLKLLLNGFIKLDNDSSYTMDVQFNAPSNEFKDILSLVPALYKSEFDKIKTNGTAAIKGFVKGTYTPTQLPAYDVDINVKEGFFQYPDLPQPVKNINLAMHVSNKDGAPDNTVIDISRGHIEMGAEPFDFKLLFRNPETSKYVDAVVKGRLNLADVAKFVKLDAGTKMAGTIWADAFAKGNMAALQQQSGAFSAGGFLDIRELYFTSAQLPQPIQHGSCKVDIQNTGGIADATSVQIRNGHIEVGTNPVDFTLQLDHPVSTMNFAGTAMGSFDLAHVSQFTQLEKGTSIKGKLTGDLSFSGSKTAIDKKAYDQISTKGTVQVSNLDYRSAAYPEGVQVQTAQLAFSPQQASLSNLQASFMKTNLTANGSLSNMLGYAVQNESLKGVLNVTADRMNLNDWMGVDTASGTATKSTVFLVPANLDLTVNAKAGSVQYDKVTYNNIRGSLLVRNETVRLQQVQTEALGGTIGFNGSYATKNNKQTPAISLDYDIKDVDVQKAFLAFNTVQKLMPVGQFLSGKLSSQFSMNGLLKGDMMPDLTTLTGGGNFFLIQGFLSKFQPLEKLANTLSVSELKDVSLKDIKTYFEFSNGKVLVKPFNVKVKDIEMQIGGMHGLDQSIDYIIGMKVPRKYLGTAGNNLVNGLASAANSKGIPVTLSDNIDLNVKMGGTVSNPSIKTDLKQAAGDMASQLKTQAAAFVQQKMDTAKQALKDTLNVVKKQLVEDAKTELVKQVFGAKDSSGKSSSLDDTKKKATETLKNTFGNMFKKKTVDTTKKE